MRTEGGVLAPLGYRGYDAKQALLPDGHLVERCWAEMEPVARAPGHGLAETPAPHRAAAALGHPDDRRRRRGGGRGPAAKALERADARARRAGLRLDTALVFDEVRSLATLEERQRLAREIHDGVAQEIASLGYLVDDLVADAVTETQRSQLHAAARARSAAWSASCGCRSSTCAARSPPPPGSGSALSDYVRTVGARSGLTVHLTLDEAPTRLRSEVETELLRIAQEAVTNARKHSDAANLWVDCRIRPPFARITVQDDGDRAGHAARADSYGLKIMRERADRIDATLEIGTRRRHRGVAGTRVAVTVGDGAAERRPAERGTPDEPNAGALACCWSTTTS